MSAVHTGVCVYMAGRPLPLPVICLCRELRHPLIKEMLGFFTFVFFNEIYEISCIFKV